MKSSRTGRIDRVWKRAGPRWNCSIYKFSDGPARVDPCRYYDFTKL